MNDIPLDVQVAWLPVIRRLQSVAKSGGISVLSIKIVVNKDGEPLFWLSPEVQLVEPRSRSDLIISLIKNEDK
jgi:hypothetical protein